MAAGTGNLEYHLAVGGVAYACQYPASAGRHPHGSASSRRGRVPVRLSERRHRQPVFRRRRPGHQPRIHRASRLRGSPTPPPEDAGTPAPRSGQPDLEVDRSISPFATAQKGGAKGTNKADVSRNPRARQDNEHDLGEVSRELFAQFLHRIRREFRGKAGLLGLFLLHPENTSTRPTIRNSRDRIFRFGFERGFMFSSVNLPAPPAQTNSWGTLLWDLARTAGLDAQDIVLDVYDTRAQKTGHQAAGQRAPRPLPLQVDQAPGRRGRVPAVLFRDHGEDGGAGYHATVSAPDLSGP